MTTRGDQIAQLLRAKRQDENEEEKQEALRLQQLFDDRVHRDLLRTKEFLRQSRAAIDRLEKDPRDPRDPRDPENPREPSELPEQPPNPEKERKARAVALYETGRTLAFVPKKNDLIGPATAVHVTLAMARQQRLAVAEMQKENLQMEASVDELRRSLADYRAVLALLDGRIERHPGQMEQLREKMAAAEQPETDLAGGVAKAADTARKLEDHVNHHVSRVVTKIHAMMDWESSQLQDEASFHRSISMSLELLAVLVSNLVAGNGLWTRISQESTLVQVMHRSNLIRVKDDNGIWIQLREFGQ